MSKQSIHTYCLIFLQHKEAPSFAECWLKTIRSKSSPLKIGDSVIAQNKSIVVAKRLCGKTFPKIRWSVNQKCKFLRQLESELWHDENWFLVWLFPLTRDIVMLAKIFSTTPANVKNEDGMKS